MTIRKYSSRSQQTTLSSGINATATTMTVTSASNLMASVTPSGGETYTVVIDPDTAVEEIVDVTGVAGSVLTIVRGVDNAGSGSLHSPGAIVRHMVIGRDLNEANAHIEGSLAGHAATTSAQLRGVISDETGTGSLVFGTSPTLSSPTITGTGAIAGTFTGNLTGNVTGNVSGTSGSTTGNAATATALATGRTIALTGDVTGTTGTFDGTGNVTMTAAIGTGVIVNADINASAAIDKTKISGTAITAGDTGTVTSAMIANDTIVNEDINTSAQIAYSKINATNSIVNADINASAAIDKTKISGTAITAADTGTVTSTMIADGTIVNGDINSSAAIDKTKISGTAVTVADTGTVTSTMILDGTIVDADINASAAIAWTKIAPSSLVSATELGYVDGVTSSIQTQLDAKLATATAASTYAPLASPALTGVPTAPTATAGTNTTQVATTAFVGTAVSNLVAAAPAALDTLNELATALGNDASFSTTVTNNLATKLPLAGGTMSGAIAMGTNKITGLGTPTTSGDAATKDYADTKLPLAGGTLSGAIAMGTNKITGLGTPTATGDAATKDYADTKLALSGGTMSGAIAMGTNKITGVGDPTSAQDVATKNYIDTAVLAPSNLTGPITSVGAATSIASQTGTGTKFVMDNTPTLITPVLGVATATSINGTTIPSSKTLVATDSTEYVVPSQTGNSGKALVTNGTTSSWSSTINGTAIPATKTLVVTTDKLSALAATTSAELAGVISDETGSGALVFANTPVINGATITATGQTPVIHGILIPSTHSIYFEGNTDDAFETTLSVVEPTADRTVSLPNATTTLVGTDTTDTLTNKTLTAPIISSISNTGTLTLPTSTDTLVGRATTDTLTNKTLTTPVISSISNSGTVTIPTGTVTLATLTGTETFTNKTLTDAKINLGIDPETASYTAVLANNSQIVTMNNASANTFSIPTDASVAFPDGTQITVLQIGAGQTTIQAVTPGTTTINSTGGTATAPKLRVRYSSATCIKLSTNNWVVIGDIS